MATSSYTATSNVLEIDRPEQLKALGHPLRLKVLHALSDKDEALTNRELAARLGVDPGHLHFHVRMLHRTGLIELAPGGRGREKPYRAVAAHVRVSPELRAAGLGGEFRAAMLEQIRRGWDTYGRTGEFRVTQINTRIDPERIAELAELLIERTDELEEDDRAVYVLTLVGHPSTKEPNE
jgi:DNA-binding transcriptional ArsR family regulator